MFVFPACFKSYISLFQQLLSERLYGVWLCVVLSVDEYLRELLTGFPSFSALFLSIILEDRVCYTLEFSERYAIHFEKMMI